jgi:3-deoxy-manno-octulosonate cytidylyltransferase (CMP-KDO synthetase)
MSAIQIVLPARLGSTRLNEKLLQRVAGKSVLQHTYDAASRAACGANRPVVAVDHRRLAEEVETFGGRWVMTPADCPSGTDRIAAAAEQLPAASIFVNVQSDEPEIDPAAIDAVANALAFDPSADIATAAAPIRSAAALANPSIVKVVMAEFRGAAATGIGSHAGRHDGGGGETAEPGGGAGQGRAVYFSRACVPHDRDGSAADRLRQWPPLYWHHLGLYAYRRNFLRWFTAAPPSPLEQVEKLEQLRAIEAGKKIIVVHVPEARSGIDTADDLEAFRSRLTPRV